MTGAIAPAGHPAAYDILVGLHVVCVVIGFGSVAISGVYGAIGRHSPGRQARPEAVVELRRFFSADSKFGYFLIAGPVFGVAALAVRPGGSEFGAIWAVAGLVIWLAASVLLLAGVRPAEHRIRAALSKAPEEDRPARELPGACGRLMWAAAASDVMFVVALLLMVTQPR